MIFLPIVRMFAIDCKNPINFSSSFTLLNLMSSTSEVRPGQNILKRRSIDSTVTIPYERTFRNLDERPVGGAGEDGFNFCGCGW